MDREQFDKLIFNREYWDTHGGAPTNRPYWDSVRLPSGQELQRLFVDATRHTEWTDFHEEAKRAIEAVEMHYDHWAQDWVRRGSVPLASTPHYLWEGGTLWINVLCPSREAFMQTISDAQYELAHQLVRLAESEVTHPSAWCNDEQNADVQRLLQSL